MKTYLSNRTVFEDLARYGSKYQEGGGTYTPDDVVRLLDRMRARGKIPEDVLEAIKQDSLHTVKAVGKNYQQLKGLL